MSKTRAREDRKVNTPAQMWARLTPLQRRTLDAMGDEHPVGAPWHALLALIDWGLIVERKQGFVLTVWGKQTRDYGREGRPLA